MKWFSTVVHAVFTGNWNQTWIKRFWNDNYFITTYCTIIILRTMHALEWRTVSALARGLFWCLFPELRSSERSKQQNSTRLRAETVRHESVYIISYLCGRIICNHHFTVLDTFPKARAGVCIVWWLFTSQTLIETSLCDIHVWRTFCNIFKVVIKLYNKTYASHCYSDRLSIEAMLLIDWYTIAWQVDRLRL